MDNYLYDLTNCGGSSGSYISSTSCKSGLRVSVPHLQRVKEVVIHCQENLKKCVKIRSKINITVIEEVPADKIKQPIVVLNNDTMVNG